MKKIIHKQIWIKNLPYFWLKVNENKKKSISIVDSMERFSRIHIIWSIGKWNTLEEIIVFNHFDFKIVQVWCLEI